MRKKKDLVQNNDLSFSYSKFKLSSGSQVEKSNRELDDLELRREGRVDAIYLADLLYR